MLEVNSFLSSFLHDSTTESDKEVQRELLKMPILRLYRAKQYDIKERGDNDQTYFCLFDFMRPDSDE